MQYGVKWPISKSNLRHLILSKLAIRYIITPQSIIFNSIDKFLDRILLQLNEQAPLSSNFATNLSTPEKWKA